MFTDKPVGKLPLSHGLGPMTLKMGERDVEAMRSLLPSFLMQAVSNPGVTQFRYHEETGNGYEYEERAIYNLDENTILTNAGACPRMYNHHVGSTCSVCGMVD
jgi:hypothetical protein